jgi:hypothetical protein
MATAVMEAIGREGSEEDCKGKGDLLERGDMFRSFLTSPSLSTSNLHGCFATCPLCLAGSGDFKGREEDDAGAGRESCGCGDGSVRGIDDT